MPDATRIDMFRPLGREEMFAALGAFDHPAGARDF
jgi:hypothetical protein